MCCACCVQRDPAQRPTARQLYQLLQACPGAQGPQVGGGPPPSPFEAAETTGSARAADGHTGGLHSGGTNGSLMSSRVRPWGRNQIPGYPPGDVPWGWRGPCVERGGAWRGVVPTDVALIGVLHVTNTIFDKISPLYPTSISAAISTCCLACPCHSINPPLLYACLMFPHMVCASCPLPVCVCVFRPFAPPL